MGRSNGPAERENRDKKVSGQSFLRSALKVWCSGRDLDPGLRLERPEYLTELYYRSLIVLLRFENNACNYLLLRILQRRPFRCSEHIQSPLLLICSLLTNLLLGIRSLSSLTHWLQPTLDSPRSLMAMTSIHRKRGTKVTL